MSIYENELTKSVLTLLAYNNIFAWRQNNGGVYDPSTKRYRANSSMSGVPDIIGILPDGKFLGIEIKSPKGKQTESQNLFELKCIESKGVYILVNDSYKFTQKMSQIVANWRGE